MGGAGTVDDFSPEAMQKESCLLGSDIYSLNNTVDLKAYRYGNEIFSAHKKLILGAKEEILLQTFVWESESQSAQMIFSGLRELSINRQKACTEGDQPSCVRPASSNHKVFP